MDDTMNNRLAYGMKGRSFKAYRVVYPIAALQDTPEVCLGAHDLPDVCQRHNQQIGQCALGLQMTSNYQGQLTAKLSRVIRVKFTKGQQDERSVELGQAPGVHGTRS